jgi:hypothetical protein
MVNSKKEYIEQINLIDSEKLLIFLTAGHIFESCVEIFLLDSDINSFP